MTNYNEDEQPATPLPDREDTVASGEMGYPAATPIEDNGSETEQPSDPATPNE